MNRWMLSAVALAAAGTALAKLPPPDDAAKAKAAETAAKAGWQAKVDTYLLCKAQDKVAAAYKKTHPEAAKSADAQPANIQAAATANAKPGAPPVPGAAGAAAIAAPSAATAAASAATPAAKAASGAASSTGGPATPVAAATPAGGAMPACADPGPFAYAPPDQKPLETSGAHSPAANAISPPSVRPESGTMTSGKTGEAPKK